MRREFVVAALLLAVACLAVSPSASAQARKKKAFSGCEKGTHLGKVAITVERQDGTCRVTDVTPASVCVAPNGAIRWEVYSDCDVSVGEDPALEVTRPDPKTAFFDPHTGDRPAILEDCRIAAVSSTKKNLFFCDINEDAHEGFYKYGLVGQIEGVDPGIEVRGPRAP